jgi:hypothetical protein
MSVVGRWKVTGRAAAATAAVIAGLGYAAVPAGAVQAAGRAGTGQLATGGVSPTAAAGTPQLNKVGTGKSNQEVIRQLVQCGSTMYAVGRFTSIQQNGTIYAVNNIFSFKATSPFTVNASWLPDVNGQVNAIAFSGGNCGDAYIGGDFTSVNGTPANFIAEIDTTTGNVVSAFKHSANAEVWSIVATATGHLLVGGDFKFISGSQTPYLASLDPTTGLNDGFVHLAITGDYDYCAAGGKPCTNSHHSQVYNQQLSHGGTLDLVEGRFTSVGGQPRQQIFMLNLSGAKAAVTNWTSPEWDGSDPSSFPYYQCWPSEAFYIRSAAWSPDDSHVYMATTGFHPALTNSNPRKGLCDSVTAWPATMPATGPLTHIWIKYSGCDSYYSVGADTGAVYAAGHPRWADNPNACNVQGTGAIVDPGLQGFDPATGTVELNSGGTALYTMTRANADNMLITSKGLWIGSTNRYTLNRCGDTNARHAGICFLPYPT